MANLTQRILCNTSKIHCQLVKEFHYTPAVNSNIKWRQKNKLHENPNSFGPLTNLPDYSYADGRPVPYGINQMRRIDEQKQNLLKIKKLVDEIDCAVEMHAKAQKEAEEAKQKILDSKLKSKSNKVFKQLDNK